MAYMVTEPQRFRMVYEMKNGGTVSRPLSITDIRNLMTEGLLKQCLSEGTIIHVPASKLVTLPIKVDTNGENF